MRAGHAVQVPLPLLPSLPSLPFLWQWALPLLLPLLHPRSAQFMPSRLPAPLAGTYGPRAATGSTH